MDKYIVAPPSGSTNNSVGAVDRHWQKGYFDELPNWQEYLAESTGYGIVSGCTPTISGLTVTVAAGVVHLAGGTRKEIASTNITLDAADSTNPRIDLVYITSAGEVAKVTGTAAASPSAPALPSGGISVCNVSVAASSTTGTVTDSRGMLPRFYNTGIVSVKDFGAVGDGVTDDTAAIQAAVNCGGVILFPQGTYIITDMITVPCTSHLFATGRVMLKTLVDGFVFYFKGEYMPENDNYTEMSYPLMGGLGGYFYMYNMQIDIDGDITNNNAIKVGDAGDALQHFGRAMFDNIRCWFYNSAFAITGHNFYLATFTNIHIEFGTYGVILNYNSESDNSGENVNFDRCVFGNTKYAIYFGNTGGFSIYLTRCSMDYIGSCFSGIINKKSIFFDNGHIEQVEHNKFSLSGYGGILHGEGDCSLIVSNTYLVNYINEKIEKIITWANNRIIVFDNIIHGINTGIMLNADKGFFLSNKYINKKNIEMTLGFIPTSRANNIIPNGDLSDGVDDYQVTKTSNMTVTTGSGTNQFTSGANEIIATCNTNGTGTLTITKTIPVKALHRYICTYVMLSSNSYTDRGLEIRFLDLNHNVIGSVITGLISPDSNWTTLKLPATGLQASAPKNACYMQMKFILGTTTLSVGDTLKFEYCHAEDLTNTEENVPNNVGSMISNKWIAGGATYSFDVLGLYQVVVKSGGAYLLTYAAGGGAVTTLVSATGVSVTMSGNTATISNSGSDGVEIYVFRLSAI